MLTPDHIAGRKAEISQARAGFAAQLAQFEDNCAKLRTRLANIDGALELITMFEKDAENVKTPEELAGEQAAAEGEQPPQSEQPAEQAEAA